MSIFDEMFEEDEKIADDLYGFLPEEREEYLMSVYGRSKEEFPWVDFGDDTESSASDASDDFDSDDDDFDEDRDDFDTDGDDDPW